jgi:hypothetical protein
VAAGVQDPNKRALALLLCERMLDVGDLDEYGWLSLCLLMQ